VARLIKKAVRVYKNRGLKGLAHKTRRYAGKRLRGAGEKLRFKRVSYDQKRLREEYSFLSNEIFQVTADDIAASRKVSSGPKPTNIQTATWFVPYFDHFAFNGIQTIFRFIEKMSKEGVKNRIVIFDNPAFDAANFETQMKDSFPGIENYEIVVFGEDKIKGVKALPESDIAFCTIWMSAYVLLRYNKTRRKYYFIQDYEPMFYEAGSTSALAQSTYRFGFNGVVNTPGLLAAVNQRDGLEGMSFIPTVNLQRYHPDPSKKKSKKVRIFMYARPYNPRNAFNLGILTIQQLLKRYGKNIEIITAGADWKEAEYGLKGKITNLGLLKSLDEVADLYRTCDIGFSYMLTPHTSYQMLEYSASGMATVMNHNEDHLWLHKDGVNCLLAEPSPADMAQKISRLIDDPKLRQKLVTNAQKELAYTWEQQMDRLWNEVTNGKN
jgi:glycosyltransferase involved in cell wall biosynthesis